MSVVIEREHSKRPSRRIEIYDAYLGGEIAGERGRESLNKVIVVVAVETAQVSRPVIIQLYSVQCFLHWEIPSL